jgi:hypothetical protein
MVQPYHKQLLAHLVQLMWEQQQVARGLLASCQQQASGRHWAQRLLPPQRACWKAPQQLLLLLVVVVVPTRLVVWARTLLLKAWVQPYLLLQELSHQQGPTCLTPW